MRRGTINIHEGLHVNTKLLIFIKLPSLFLLHNYKLKINKQQSKSSIKQLKHSVNMRMLHQIKCIGQMAHKTKSIRYAKLKLNSEQWTVPSPAGILWILLEATTQKESVHNYLQCCIFSSLWPLNADNNSFY